MSFIATEAVTTGAVRGKEQLCVCGHRGKMGAEVTEHVRVKDLGGGRLEAPVFQDKVPTQF